MDDRLGNDCSTDEIEKRKLKNDDVEQKSHRPSRFGPINAGLDDEDRADVGKQLALEADNSIRYRTCSWQKVVEFLI